MSVSITKMNRVASAAELERRFADSGFDLPVHEDLSPLTTPLERDGRRIGNRFCILPMEGWDAERDGSPSELVRRRWLNFATGGAKLLWGCEAAAILPEARANPNQLMILPETADAIARLRADMVEAHRQRFGDTVDLVIGLQLTHSGRFSRPDGPFAPRTAYRHDVLDGRVGAADSSLLTDDELAELASCFVDRARLAQQAGFDFVDFKHCHGYLCHELLSAVDRPGDYGGSFEHRTRFLREVIEGIQAQVPGLGIGVRISAYDFLPFQPGEGGTGTPCPTTQPFRFGANPDGLDVDLGECFQFLALLESLGVDRVCVTAGSPYYNPHIQRPALYPPSDGYLAPEDPLVGVARMLDVTRTIKARFPDMLVVGTGYSYLQDWLPQVAAGMLASGAVDSVGLGRMALSYPDLPADIAAGKALARKKICRTFSDCTTAPRNGLVSGCYPLDPFYKKRPEAKTLKAIKKKA